MGSVLARRAPRDQPKSDARRAQYKLAASSNGQRPLDDAGSTTLLPWRPDGVTM
jgi:hypothetical protein